jgi:Flp pilus assembly protein TadD
MEILQWRKALQSGDNKRYWTNLSMAYMRIGEKESAFHAARRAYLLDTSWANGVYNMAVAFDEMQMLDSAITCYARAAQLEPDDLAMRHDLAIALMRYGRTSDAVEQINVAIKHAPDSAMYQGALGWILLNAGYLVEAERALKSALQLDPNLVPALANLARLYRQTGRNEEALTELARLLEFPDLEPELRAYLVSLEQQIRYGISRPDTTK